MKDAYSFLYFVSSLNKIKESKVHIFMKVFSIYSSTNPSELYNALFFFKVLSKLPDEYKTIEIKDIVSVMLFLRGELELSFVKDIIENKFKLKPDGKREMNAKD